MQAAYTVVYHSLLSISLTWPHTSAVLPSPLSWDLLLALSPPPPPSTSISQVCEFQSSLLGNFLPLIQSRWTQWHQKTLCSWRWSQRVLSSSGQWPTYPTPQRHNYVVQYGTSRETLVHNSSRRASEEGTTTYSVPLSGLRDNTNVQVLATNTALRSSRSSVESFTTLVKTSAGVR